MPLTLTRSLLTVLIPGAVAVAPWGLLLLSKYMWLQSLYEAHPYPFHIVCVSVAILAGCLIEGLSSYIEKAWDCRLAKKPAPNPDEDWVDRDWYDYLARNHGAGEPVAYRYLSRKVTTLYFELGIAISSAACFLGVLHIALDAVVSRWALCAIVAAYFAGPVLLVIFAGHTHEVLCDTRHRIMERFRRSDSALPEPRI